MFGFDRLYYEVHSAARHRRPRPTTARRPRQRTHKRIVVDDPARMGRYPLLFGTFVPYSNGSPYNPALDLAQKLSQVDIRLLAKLKSKIQK